MIGVNRKVILFSYMIMVTFFSVLRESILIYFEVIVAVVAAAYLIITPRRKLLFPLSILVISFLGNFVAPMDNVARFESDYPSLHTMSIMFGIKCIDIVVMIMGGGVLFNLVRGRVSIQVNRVGVILFILMFSISLLTFITQKDFVYDIGYMLFICRCLVLSFSFYFFMCNLNDRELSFLSKLAILTCVSLMVFAHLIHAANPMQRELFGINLTVAFAGDEYGSIGLLLASLLLIGKNTKQFCYIAIVVCFCLAIYAGRKSAVPYFGFVILMVYFYGENGDKLGLHKKVILLSEHIYISIAILFISWLDYAPLNSAFHESIGILKPTISSLMDFLHENIFFYCFGVGPFTKYPLVGINPLFDHPFSFGADAGNLYKIKLWFFPFERTLLSFGGLIPLLFLFRLLFFQKHTSASFYISLYGFYLLFLNPVSIVMCICLAIAFSAQRVKQRENKLNYYFN